MDENTEEKVIYPTVSEILKLPAFHRCKLVAGKRGLFRWVKGINLSDTPNYDQWISEGEILITTCHAVYDDEKALEEFVPNCASAELAGIFVKEAPYLLKISERMIEQAEQAKIPLIKVPADMQFSVLTKAYFDEMMRRGSEELEEELRVNDILEESIIGGATLGEIADMTADIIPTSILILDIINDRCVFRLWKGHKKRFRNYSESDIEHYFIKNAQRFEITVGARPVGVMYLILQSDITSINRRLLSRILRLVSIEIAREEYRLEFRKSDFAEFFRQVISRNKTQKICDAQRGREFGVTENARMIVCRMRIGGDCQNHLCEKDYQKSFIVSDLRTSLNGRGIPARIVSTEDDYVIILKIGGNGSEEVENPVDHMLGELLERHETCEIHLGLSRIHGGVTGLDRCNTEAEIALRTAMESGERMILFQNLDILRLIYAERPEEEIEIFVREILGNVIEYGKLKKTDLVGTLACYLKHNGNLRQVSRELFIHYNTAVYRMEKIEELLGFEWESGSGRLRLELAIYLYNIYSKMQ